MIDPPPYDATPEELEEYRLGFASLPTSIVLHDDRTGLAHFLGGGYSLFTYTANTVRLISPATGRPTRRTPLVRWREESLAQHVQDMVAEGSRHLMREY